MPQNDVTGKFGESYQQLGQNIRANGHRVGLNGFGNLIEAVGIAARYYNEEKGKDTKEDRLWKIEEKGKLDQDIIKAASENRYNPEGFQKAYEEIKAKHYENVPEKHQQWFLETAGNSFNGYFHTVNFNKEEQEYSRGLDTYVTNSQKLEAEAMHYAKTGNQAAYNEAMQEWLANEENMFKDGFVTRSTLLNRRQAFVDEALVEQHKGFAKQAFGNPEQLNGILNKVEKSNTYTPKQKLSITNAIKAEYNTWQAQNKVANKDLTDSADFGIKAFNAGIEPKNFNYATTLNSLMEKGLTGKAAELQNAYSNRKVMQTFAGFSLPQMDAELKNFKNNAKSKEDLALIKNLESLKDSAETAIYNDPLDFAIEHGVIEDNGLDYTNPESIANRVSNAKLVQEKYGLKEAPILTKTDEKTLIQLLDRASAVDKTRILSNLSNTFDNESFYTIINKIAPKNPEFAQAANVFKDDPDTALGIIEGSDILKNQPEFKSGTDDEFNEAFYKKIDSNTFRALDASYANGVKQTIKALMAKKNKEKGITDHSFNEDVFKEAFKEVVGDVATIDMDGTGFWDDTFKTPTPKGVSASEFEDWYDHIGDEEMDGAYTVTGHKVNAYSLHEFGSLQIIGENQYAVFYKGTPVVKNDKPMIISYKKRKIDYNNGINAPFYEGGK